MALERLRDRWNAFEKTPLGDVGATVVAITLVSVVFVACTLAVIGIVHAASLMFERVG